MSGKGAGRIDRRRRRHGHHGLRRMHERDRQRVAAYNLARGRLTPTVQAALVRAVVVRRRRALPPGPVGFTVGGGG